VVRCNRSGGPQRCGRSTSAIRAPATALVEHVTAAHGRLDGVIVAAGIVAFGDLVDTDDVVIEELFLTNALGPMWLAKHVARAAGVAGILREPVRAWSPRPPCREWPPTRRRRRPRRGDRIDPA
jgi:NAD(P)-dependent dehydrogenase (short-subunit alcohol dehydrogenase family)